MLPFLAYHCVIPLSSPLSNSGLFLCHTPISGGYPPQQQQAAYNAQVQSAWAQQYGYGGTQPAAAGRPGGYQ